MKMLLLDPETGAQIVDASGLDDYYRLIGCDLIDIAVRKIDGRPYDIIVDDEGLLKEEPKISAVNIMGKAMLVGKLLFACFDRETGEEMPLNDEDITHIQNNIIKLPTRLYSDGLYMVTNVDY